MAEVMYRAITMSTTDREERMNKLKQQVKENLNAEQWVHKNLEPLMAHDSKARL
jgi:trehalose-6-phosphate synthase